MFKAFLYAVVLTAASVVQAQTWDVVESERLQKLEQAQTLEEAVDLMTPEELAEEFGITPEMEWLSLFHNTNTDALVKIDVSISQQRLVITHPGGQNVHVVSTGKRGYPTARGCYRPYLMKRMHYSRKYNNAPMPHSMFYVGGYALHATTEEHRLGQPASHGCVRLSRQSAAEIYNIVARVGQQNALICVR